MHTPLFSHYTPFFSSSPHPTEVLGVAYPFLSCIYVPEIVGRLILCVIVTVSAKTPAVVWSHLDVTVILAVTLTVVLTKGTENTANVLLLSAEITTITSSAVLTNN